MSRALPYAKKLMARRAAGERPWLVLVTMGDGGDRVLAKVASAGLKDVPRIWVPDDFAVAEAELGWAVGLDVLVAPFMPMVEHSTIVPPRLSEFLGLLWRARLSTLWHLDTGWTATRLYPYRRFRVGTDLLPWFPRRVKLDEHFRAEVERARELALLVGDEPLFDGPEFADMRFRPMAA